MKHTHVKTVFPIVAIVSLNVLRLLKGTVKVSVWNIPHRVTSQVDGTVLTGFGKRWRCYVAGRVGCVGTWLWRWWRVPNSGDILCVTAHHVVNILFLHLLPSVAQHQGSQWPGIDISKTMIPNQSGIDWTAWEFRSGNHRQSLTAAVPGQQLARECDIRPLKERKWIQPMTSRLRRGSWMKAREHQKLWGIFVLSWNEHKNTLHSKRKINIKE